MSLFEWRGIERIVATLGGVLLVYLGYRLFIKLPERADGEGRLALPGNISVYISRVGPGGFFGLFGTGIIIASFYFSMTISLSDGTDANAPPIIHTVVATADPAPSASSGVIQYLGGSGATLVENRANVGGDIYTLNQAPAALRGEPNDLNLDDLEQAITRTKLALMWSVWGDPNDWGDYEKFRTWIENNDGQPVPREFAKPMAVFTRGQGQR